MQALIQKKQTEGQQKSKALQDNQQKLEQGGALMNDAARAALQKEIDRQQLEGLAEIALADGQVAWTVRLFAAANAVRSAHAYYSPVGMRQPFYDQTIAGARAQVGEQAFAALWTEGQQLTPLESLTTEARAPLATSGPKAVSTSTLLPLDGLTAREVEVLRLVAMGLSKNQIAEQLVISPNTVNVHIQSIYGKLGINSRSAATRYAIEHHLA